MRVGVEARAAEEAKPKQTKANMKGSFGARGLFSVEGLLLVFMERSSWRLEALLEQGGAG